MESASDGERSENVEDDEREATEMIGYEYVGRSYGSDLSTPVPPREDRTGNDGHISESSHSCYTSVKTFWRRQVAITVSHDACRDHFGKQTSIEHFAFERQYVEAFSIAFIDPPLDRATTFDLLSYLIALERTFLGYLRTSFALSVVAVLIAQLFRLQHTDNPNKTLGYFVIGIPLACVFIVAAIAVLLLGTYRFWRQQNAILRGKVHAGGWEINAIGVTVFMVCRPFTSRRAN